MRGTPRAFLATTSSSLHIPGSRQPSYHALSRILSANCSVFLIVASRHDRLVLLEDEILEYVNDLYSTIDISPEWKLTVHETESMAGGGGIPEVNLPSVALCLNHERFSAKEIYQRLRSRKPAIIGVIRKDNVHLDLRTVMKSQLNSLRESLQSLVSV